MVFMKVRQSVMKVKAFGEDDEVAEESLPVNSEKGQQFFSARKSRNGKFGQRFFKKKMKHHRLSQLSELHDEEDYAFHEMFATGCRLRVVPGYRLKRNWKAYKKSFGPQLSPRIRRTIYKKNPYPMGYPSWVDVILPDGHMMHVQPRSATPSYFERDEALETFIRERLQ
jgi:hypothetical protein